MKEKNEKRKDRNETLWFVDMDGTIAEWKYGCEDQLREPGYFRNLSPTAFLKPFREFAKKFPHRIYILSAYMTDCNALADKQEWLNEHAPEIPKENRLFVPCGTNKAEHVKTQLQAPELSDRMILFDDFSRNLHTWKKAGGRGVKCYNGINGNNGTWTGEGCMWSADVEEMLSSVTF